MKDGTLVRYRTGKVVYQAYREPGLIDDWRHKYTLVPVNGGRKRYRVSQYDVRANWSDEVKPIKTSAGKIRRPKSFNKLPEYSGCTRRAFIGKHWVFKLEKWAGDGNYKNRVEAARYAIQTGMGEVAAVERFGADAVAEATTLYKDVPIAECHLLEDGVLMMERVRSVNNLNVCDGAEELSREERLKLGYRRPAWAGNVDCEQIGYTHAGDLVAFDL